MTYNELVAALIGLVATDSSDVDFAAILPRCIEAAELRIARELLPVAHLSTAQSTLTAGSAAITLPTDFVAPRSFTLYTPAGSKTRAELLRRDSRFLAEYWPDATVTGIPKYWAEISFDSCLVAPTPGASYTLELLYFRRPPGLSAANPTTWVSIWTPDLLLHAARAWLSGYLKEYGAGDDPKGPIFWEGEYQRTMKDAIGEEMMRRGMSDTPPGLKPST